MLYPGRVILGVGSGESLNEVPLGLEWPDGKERFARLKEAVTLIRELWTGERVSFEGTYYRTDKATIYDRPEVPVPIYIGASGPAATRLAGRVADGFITTSGKAPTLYSDTLLPALADGAGKAGRTLADLDLLIEMKVSFDPDKARALADTKYWGALALTPEQKSGVEDPIEMQRLADALPVRAGRVPVDRLGRPGRARREDQALPRPGLSAPGVPCARPGPEAIPAACTASRCCPGCGRSALPDARRARAKLDPATRQGRVRQDRRAHRL